LCKRTSSDDDEHLLQTLIINKNKYNKELFGKEKEILLLIKIMKKIQSILT
jgi:hypothetical protein